MRAFGADRRWGQRRGMLEYLYRLVGVAGLAEREAKGHLHRVALLVLARQRAKAVERGATQIDVLRNGQRLLQRAERPLDVLIETRLHAVEIGVEHLLQSRVGVQPLSIGA